MIKMRSLLKDEKGVAAIIVAIVMVSLIGTVAIVADIGLAYQEKSQLQTAVDAAALAAAEVLAENGTQQEAEAEATNYLQKNANVSPSQVTITYPTENTVRVFATTERNTVFASILGQNNIEVGSGATAQYELATTTNNLMPLIVPSQSVSDHIGEENEASFELGADRPLDSFSISHVEDGNVLTYTIIYINTNSESIDLTLWAEIPNGTCYNQGSASDNGSFDGQHVNWSFSNVSPDDEIIVTFTVTKTGGNVGNGKAYAQTNLSQNQEVANEGGQSQQGFFWLADFNGGSSGVPEFEDWIINGYPEDVTVGMVAIGKGVKASLKSALQERMEKDPTVVLPLYNYTESAGGNKAYHVVGFSEFVITGINFHGHPKTISGYFTTGTVTSGSSDASKEAEDFDVEAVQLVE
jgi:Flp pilus assembly protein TadG